MKNYQLSLLRNKIYKILSLCFYYPDKNFHRYANEELLEDLETRLKQMPYIDKIEAINYIFQSTLRSNLLRLSLDDLQVEYTGLFIYSKGMNCCLPYESIHGEKHKELMGDSTMAIKKFYRQYKLRTSSQFKDLPDHIAAELEFMHFLSFNEAIFQVNEQIAIVNMCVKDESRFLKNHLLKWIPKFVKCLEKVSKSSFYMPLSQVVIQFLIADANYLLCRKDSNKIKPPNIKMKTSEFDFSTLTVLEKDNALSDSDVRWVYTTSPERYWYSPVKVKVIDGKAVKIVARNDVAFFDGKQDIRAFACFAKIYGADRLKFPLKRVGERGEGIFKRISWDEALCEIATVLKKYRDEGNAKYVGFLRTHPPLEYMFNHFTHHYGSPNDVHASATSCFADGKVARSLTGVDPGKDDYLNSKYTVYIGHTSLCGIREIPRASRFSEGIRRGMKFVFVDPRLNEGSYIHGAEWIPIKPGTDSAFILAMINVIIRENLYDKHFLRKYTNASLLIKPNRMPLKNKKEEYLVWDLSVANVRPINEALNPALSGNYEVKLDTYEGICKTAFQLLAERAKTYPLDKVSKITTIKKEKIEEIALKLGTMKPQVCIYDPNQNNVSAQYSNSLQYYRARYVLMCLLGIFDKPGGKYYGPYGPTGIELNRGSDFRIPIEVHPMTQDRVDFDPHVHPSINTKLEHYPLGVIQNFLKAIKSGKPYPIKALFIIGCDMLASHSSEWREAFKNVEFIVKSHVWPDDDVDYADIVLPEAAYLERDDGFATVSVPDPVNKDTEFSFLSIVQQVVEPQFEQRPWTDYIKELAQRIGFGEYYDFSLDEYWNFLLKPMAIDIDYLRKHGVFYPTPLVTRKIEFYKKKMNRLNIYSYEMADLWHQHNQDAFFDPLPIYHPIRIEPKEKNEFYFISGKCSYFKCNFYRNNQMLLERYLEGELGNTLLWINTKKAVELGIRDLDWVWIESATTGEKGKVRVKVTEGIHPSSVWHVYGFGRESTQMSKNLRSRLGINVQKFIPEHYVLFTAGQAHCEAIVKIYKV